MTVEPTLDDLRDAVRLACRPQNDGRIRSGHRQVLAMPRGWVLANFERVATEVLDFSDDWEFRRLLELADELDRSLARRFFAAGWRGGNPDVREAVEDWKDAGA